MNKWITYANEYIAAKELTIEPEPIVIIKDKVAYGCIIKMGTIITKEQIKQYEKDGFVILRKIISTEYWKDDQSLFLKKIVKAYQEFV